MSVYAHKGRRNCIILFVRYPSLSLYHAECDKLRKDGFRSSQYYSQGPIFSDPLQSTNSLQGEEDDDNDKKVRTPPVHAKSTRINIMLITYKALQEVKYVCSQ